MVVQGYSPHLKEVASHEHNTVFIESFNDQSFGLGSFLCRWMLVGQPSRIRLDWSLGMDSINNFELTEGTLLNSVELRHRYNRVDDVC